MKYAFIILLFASCMEDKKNESRQLDVEVQELQRLAFWQRAYYFEALKWKDNSDSVNFYERKVDSVVALYKQQMIRYDTMVKLYQQNK